MIFKEFYVSTVGSDKNSGIKNAPFFSIGRAREEVVKYCDNMEGDILVNIEPGYYRLNKTEIFDELCSGKNGFNVIFRGVDKQSPPLISGGTKITGWKKCEDGKLWSAPAEVKEIRTLYINGLPAQRAVSRYLYEPIDLYHEEESIHVADGIMVSAENFRSDFECPEEMELVWPLLWTHQRTPVKDIIKVGDKVIIKMKHPCFDYARTKKCTYTNPGATNEQGGRRKRFYLENAKELIDEPGEFYFSKAEQRVYYYPFEEEDLEKSEIYAGTTEFLIKIKGSDKNNKIHNIIFDNLDFRYGAWNGVTDEGLIAMQADLIVTEMDADRQGGKPIPAQIEITNAENLQIRNCRIRSMGSSAISMCDGVKNSSICGNIIMDISGTGIVIDHWDHGKNIPDSMERCENIIVTNNVIHRVATEFRGTAAIAGYFPKNLTVSHNDIKNVPYTGIALGWGWGTEDATEACDNCIVYNRIEDVTDVAHDGGHIYTLDTLKGGLIQGNYLIQAGDYRGGIYLDEGTRDVKVIGNVVENSEQWMFARPFVNIERVTAYGNYFEEGSYAILDDVNVTHYDNRAIGHDLKGNIVWPEEARKIMAHAGLENHYKYLLSETELPKWRKDVLDYQPQAEFADEKSTWVSAAGFIRGAGEGSAYHTADGKSVKLYSDHMGSMLNESNAGDWLMYDAYVLKSEEYHVQVKYADREEVTTITPKINLYVDGQLVIQNAELPSVGYWSDKWRRPCIPYPVYTIGTVKLEKGNHNVKVEFVDNTTSFEAWRFYNKSVLDEMVYDEGMY